MSTVLNIIATIIGIVFKSDHATNPYFTHEDNNYFCVLRSNGQTLSVHEVDKENETNRPIGILHRIEQSNLKSMPEYTGKLLGSDEQVWALLDLNELDIVFENADGRMRRLQAAYQLLMDCHDVAKEPKQMELPMAPAAKALEEEPMPNVDDPPANGHKKHYKFELHAYTYRRLGNGYERARTAKGVARFYLDTGAVRFYIKKSSIVNNTLQLRTYDSKTGKLRKQHTLVKNDNRSGQKSTLYETRTVDGYKIEVRVQKIKATIDTWF